MKTKLSNFLIKSKPILKEIIAELRKDFDYVSILGADSGGSTYSVSKAVTSVRDGSDNERGFVCRVYNGDFYSEYSFDDISDKDLLIRKIKETAVSDKSFLEKEGIKFKKYPIIKEDNIQETMTSEMQIGIDEISVEEKIKKLSEIKEEAFSAAQDLVEISVIYMEQNVNKIFLSDNKDLAQSYTFVNGYIIPVLSKDGDFREDYSTDSKMGGAELIDEMKDKLKKVLSETRKLFGTTTIKPGVYDIITDPSVSGLLAHEAFGHGVEMDMFVKERAKAKYYINKKVASDITNMRDGAHSALEVSSYLFDDEGVLGHDSKIIENGILKKGMCDVLSSLILGVEPTGNGKRESFKRKAYTRMTNTFFEGGNDKLEDMIKSIEYGFLLRGMNNGMEDPKNWGIQCTATRAEEIKNGEFTGKIFSPVTLTGYVPEVLGSISMISSGDDLELCGTGYCGKGSKEYVKTSTGGTYIKLRGRLS